VCGGRVNQSTVTQAEPVTADESSGVCPASDGLTLQDNLNQVITMRFPLRILVVTPRFAISGVPLAQIRFARALSRAGHEVDLVVGYVNDGHQMPNVDGVNVKVWGKNRVIKMIPALIKYFIEIKPDIVFSAEDHLNSIVLLAAILSRSRARISCSSRVTPFDTYSNVFLSKRWILKQFMRAVMPRANALTCVSKDMVDQYKNVFKSSRHVCVYNIVEDGQSKERMLEPVVEEWFDDKSEPVVVAAGSLAPWKGFSDLIFAIKELRKTRKARLIILGDGPLRADLDALIKRLGLDHAIKLLGFVDNPLKYFSRSDVFVLSSYVEGLPNVLVEAMMCGCPPVSTDCPTGPREVLMDGKYGYLVAVGDSRAIAAGIEKALENPISKELLRDAVKPFAEHEVLKRHFEVLSQRGFLCNDSSKPGMT